MGAGGRVEADAVRSQSFLSFKLTNSIARYLHLIPHYFKYLQLENFISE